MNTFALSHQLTYCNLILAAGTGDFVHIQCKLRTMGKKRTTSILPVGSVIMPHAVFFFASLSSAASHWSSVPTEHLVKVNKMKIMYISYYQVFCGILIHDNST